MAEKTMSSVELGGLEVYGVEEINQTSVQALFDNDDIQANISTQTFRFKGEANARLLELQQGNPNEGPELIPLTTDGILAYSEKYFVQFNSNFRKISAVESEAQIAQDNGIEDFQSAAAGLTIQLLVQEELWTSEDGVDIPYILKNRKQLLEALVITNKLLQIQISIFNETFKLVNIVSDIASGAWTTTVPAAVVAFLNLATTLINLVILTIKLFQELIDLYLVINPPVRLHRGMNLLNWLTKGANRLNYEIEFGADFEETLRKVNWCPSKDDEVGPTSVAVVFADLFNIPVDQGNGILKPTDFGYFYGDAIKYTKIKWNTKIGIIDGVVHLRPKNDPFWINESDFELEDVLIEEALGYSNGTSRENYEDLISQYSVTYERDNSDLHTLTDANNRVASFLTQATSAPNPVRGAIKGDVKKEIPYALCVRKTGIATTLIKFLDLEKLFNTFQDVIDKVYDAFPVLNDGDGKPDLKKLVTALFIREGAMLVENHYFSKPKVVILGDDGRIPENYADEYGAPALLRNFHSYEFMVPGWKDPDNAEETNQKIIFENVKFPFGITSWDEVKVNSWFNLPDLGKAQFRSVEWFKDDDFATVSFHIFKEWNNQLKGQLVTVGPNSTVVVE